MDIISTIQFGLAFETANMKKATITQTLTQTSSSTSSSNDYKVSPNKKLIAIQKGKGLLEIWSLESMEILRSISTFPFRNFQFSPSSSKLSVEGENEVEIYFIENSKILVIKENPNLSIREVLFSPSSAYLLVCLDFNLGLHVWNLDQLSTKEPILLPAPNGPLLQVPDLSTISYYSREKGIDFINIYDSTNFCLLKRFKAALLLTTITPTTSKPRLINNDSIFFFDDFNGILLMISLFNNNEVSILDENITNIFWSDDVALITYQNGNLFSIFNYSLLKISKRFNLNEKRSETHYVEDVDDYYIDQNADNSFSEDVQSSNQHYQNIKMKVEFSHDKSFISFRSSTNFNMIWIFSLIDLSIIAVIHQRESISNFIMWHPSKSILFFTDENCVNMYMWQPDGCLIINNTCDDSNNDNDNAISTSPIASNTKTNKTKYIKSWEWLKDDYLLIADSQKIMKVLPRNMASF